MADEDKKEAAKSEEAAPASKKAVESGNGSSPPAAALAHAGAGHAAHADHGHGLAHTMPIPMLIGILALLMALTILTVSVTSFDLGAQGNLVVAMVIATIKAGLVVAFFMHLVWD